MEIGNCLKHQKFLFCKFCFKILKTIKFFLQKVNTLTIFYKLL